MRTIVQAGCAAPDGCTILIAVNTGTLEQFGELIESGLARWSRIVKDANIKGD